MKQTSDRSVNTQYRISWFNMVSKDKPRRYGVPGPCFFVGREMEDEQRYFDSFSRTEELGVYISI